MDSNNAKIAPIEADDKRIPENPPGLSENVNDLAETPQQMLQRVLLPNENVTATFDCFFPMFMLPRWKIVLLVTSTLGLYAFVLMYRAILRWFYKKKCCTPGVVEFQRGKVAVTDKGRLICWSTDFNQLKSKRSALQGCIIKLLCCCFGRLCDPPVVYSGNIETRIYNVTDIRQISQSYNSSSAVGFLCWCCCIEYSCSISVSFQEFEIGGNQSGVLSTSTSSNFFFVLQNIIDATLSELEVRIGIGSEKILHIFSKTEDMVHNGDTKSTIDDMNSFYSRLIGILPPQPDVFVKNSELISQQVGFFKQVDDLCGVTIVSDKGNQI
jgi:hypothetical protein